MCGTEGAAAVVSMVEMPFSPRLDDRAASDAEREPGPDEGFERSTTLAMRLSVPASFA
jgi:hypothetical protein